MNAETPLQTTATGAVLAARLAKLVPDLLENRIPASIGRRISAALNDADSRMRRQAALTAAVALLDDGEVQSRWQLAQALETALTRFGGVPHRRIKAGHRAANELEAHLLTLIETDGPKCASKLWEEMRAFDIPHFPEPRE